MLRLPERGISVSRTKHTGDLQLYCDWVEGSLMFTATKRLSRSEIVDVLCEEGIYDDQEFANNWIDNVWSELERRQRLLSDAAPFEVGERAVTGKRTWAAFPAYAFCVLAPLLQRSSWLPSYSSTELATHYARQGALFEQISIEALRGAGWRTHLTGWSARKADRLPQVVGGVASTIGEPEHANWKADVSPHANEAGLDVVFFRTFSDRRSGVPIFLAQCAAGADWDTKLHTPVLSVWKKLVNFSAPPYKAFVLPHSLDADHLRRVTVKVDGVVFDRYRLHDASRLGTWCSRKLAKDLKAFLKPLIAALPTYP